MDEVKAAAVLVTTQAFVQEQLKDDCTGHDFQHIKRVLRLADKIAQSEDLTDQERFTVQMGALLHDSIDDKVISNVQQAFGLVQTFLQEQGVSADEITEITTVIENVSFKKQLANVDLAPELNLTTQIVQDADRLDAIGAIGIARTFYYGGHQGSTMYDPKIEPRSQLSAKVYRQEQGTVINHFYEKLLILAVGMHTQKAREIAEKRQQVMEDFLTEFKKEWND